MTNKVYQSNPTRKERISRIRYLKAANRNSEAVKYWLSECPRISRQTFDKIG